LDALKYLSYDITLNNQGFQVEQNIVYDLSFYYRLLKLKKKIHCHTIIEAIVMFK